MIYATAAQKRKIWLLASQRDMDKDLLYSYIEALTGVKSIKDLDIKGAVLVIKGLSGEDVRSVKPSVEVMSSRQKGMILYLAASLGWKERDSDKVDLNRLNGYVRKEYSTLYFFNLSRSNACKCIESMKSMLERKNKKVV